MVKWSSRVAIYKFSLMCAYFVFAVYALAFSIPMWLGFDPAGADNSRIAGLWMAGMGDSGDIDDVDATGFGEPMFGGTGDAQDWVEAVRGLWVGGMAFYLFGVVASVVENCCISSSSKDYGISGFLILLSGLCGAAGIITTAIEIEDDDGDVDYLWGYILAVVASGLAIILAIVLLISKNYGDHHNEHVKNSRTADYVYAHNKHHHHHNHNNQHHSRPAYGGRGPGPEYTNPGYRGDELPLVNGVPFHSPYSMYRNGGGHHAQENGGGFHGKYDQGTGYYPYGYKDTRPGNRTSVAESADLSNGYTQDIVHAEHSLGRRGEYAGGRSQHNRAGEHYYNGNQPY